MRIGKFLPFPVPTLARVEIRARKRNNGDAKSPGARARYSARKGQQHPAGVEIADE